MSELPPGSAPPLLLEPAMELPGPGPGPDPEARRLLLLSPPDTEAGVFSPEDGGRGISTTSSPMSASPNPTPNLSDFTGTRPAPLLRLFELGVSVVEERLRGGEGKVEPGDKLGMELELELELELLG